MTEAPASTVGETHLSKAALARIERATKNPYNGGILEGKRLCKKPFVTIRLEDLNALLPFTNVYDDVVRRFWANPKATITLDEYRAIVARSGLKYPDLRDD